MTWVQNARVCLWWNVKGYNQYERTDGSSGKNRVSLRIRRGKEIGGKKKKKVDWLVQGSILCILNQKHDFFPSSVISASFEKDQSTLVIKEAINDQCNIIKWMRAGSYKVLIKDWEYKKRLLSLNVVCCQGLIFNASDILAYPVQEMYAEGGSNAGEGLQQVQTSENWKACVTSHKQVNTRRKLFSLGVGTAFWKQMVVRKFRLGLWRGFCRVRSSRTFW